MKYNERFHMHCMGHSGSIFCYILLKKVTNMPNLYQKKLIRGTCDLIWEVGNFDCLACRYH